MRSKRLQTRGGGSEGPTTPSHAEAAHARSASGGSLLTQLPADLLGLVVERLQFRDLASLACTCSSLETAAGVSPPPGRESQHSGEHSQGPRRSH